MLASQEPRNGDFVAYIEQLQKESAVRMNAKSDVAMVDTRAQSANAHSAGPESRRVATADAPGTPVLDRQQAEELVARLSRARVPGEVAASIGLIVGIFMLLVWFASDAGGLPFLVGLALTVWALSRLRRRRQQRRGAPAADGRALIAQVFGNKKQRS